MTASCSRPGCQRSPTATLVYDYDARRAVIDHLAPAHPMQYDLCDAHTDRLSVPKGWVLVDQRVTNVVELTSWRAS